MGWSKFSPRPEIDPELSEAIEKENIPLLKQVTQKQLTKYHKNHNKFDLFMAANLCNQLLLSNIKITYLLLIEKSFLRFFQSQFMESILYFSVWRINFSIQS